MINQNTLDGVAPFVVIFAISLGGEFRMFTVTEIYLSTIPNIPCTSDDHLIYIGMTRWELLQAFHTLARVIFMNGTEDARTLEQVKRIVLDVITENYQDGPLKFGADDETKGV